MPVRWMNKEEIDSPEFRSISGELKLNYGGIVGVGNLETYKEWELPFIILKIVKHRRRRILDFGPGISPLGAYLDSLGYDVTLLDVPDGWHDKIGQEEYNKMYGCNVEYIKLDILSYEWQPKKFDVIFSTSVLEHLRDPEIIPTLKQLKEKLNTDGLFLHIVDNGKHEEKLKEVSKFYEIEEIKPPGGVYEINNQTRVAFY